MSSQQQLQLRRHQRKESRSHFGSHQRRKMRSRRLRPRSIHQAPYSKLLLKQRLRLAPVRRLRFLLREPPRPRRIEAVKEQRGQQRKRRGQRQHHPPAQQQRRRPYEPHPQKCLRRRVQIPEAEFRAAVVVWIERVHLVLHLAHHREQPRVIVVRRYHVVRCFLVYSARAKRNQCYPEKEVENVPHPSAQHRQALKQNGQRRRHRQRAQPEHQHRSLQRKQIDLRIAAMKNLNYQRRKPQHQHHCSEHRKIAERLADCVEALADRRGRQNLPHSRLPVALNRILDDVKPHQREIKRTHQPDHRPQPRRVVHAAILVQLQRHLP